MMSFFMKAENKGRRFLIALSTFFKRNKFWLVCLNLLVLIRPLAAQTYSPPPNSRQDIILDSNWRFIQQDVTNAGKLLGEANAIVNATPSTPTTTTTPVRKSHALKALSSAA